MVLIDLSDISNAPLQLFHSSLLDKDIKREKETEGEVALP